MLGNNPTEQNEEYFDSTRMSFGDHIEELRIHLIRAIAGFCVFFVGSFFFAHPILVFISAPVEAQLKKLHKERQEKLLAELKADPKYQEATAPKTEILRIESAPFLNGNFDVSKLKFTKDKKHVELSILVEQQKNVDLMQFVAEKLGPQPSLKTFNIQEALMVYLKVCVVTGLVLGSPWIFYQIWAFIAAGLYPHEKKLVNVYLPFSIGLFVGGVIFCQFIVIPRAVEALLWFNKWLGFEPELRLTEWLSFAIMVPVVFGLSFQTPLVMMFLDRIGVGSIEIYRKFRRVAWFVMAIVAAVLTPTIDPQTLLLMWVPMCLFYEIGILLCKLSPRRPLLDFDDPESDEMIEV